VEEKFSSETIDLESSKFNVQWRKILKQGTWYGDVSQGTKFYVQILLSKPFGHSTLNRNCCDKPKKFGNAIYKSTFDFKIRYSE
jgi:hypothetical protein